MPNFSASGTGSAPVAAAQFRRYCLFLDVDGTLLELADSPGGVAVDEALLPLLTRLRDAAGGAIALVSGRTIENLDGLLNTTWLAMAGALPPMKFAIDCDYRGMPLAKTESSHACPDRWRPLQ